MATAPLPTPQPIPPTIADLISKAIDDADRTKTWTAERAGIPATTFLRKLGGRGEFNVSQIADIAKALGIPPASLLPAEFRVAYDTAA